MSDASARSRRKAAKVLRHLGWACEHIEAAAYAAERDDMRSCRDAVEKLCQVAQRARTIVEPGR